MKRITKHTVFWLLFLVMAFPLLQDRLGIIESLPLVGVYLNPEKPEFSSESWNEGSFQQKYDEYIKYNYGLRADVVRMMNQVNASLFKVYIMPDQIEGKEGYLFSKGNIDKYYGGQFVGDEQIKEQSIKLKYIQEELAKRGQELLVTIPAGKEYYVPEYLPVSTRQKSDRGNYEAYTSMFQKLGINHFDVNKYFLAMKDTTSYPLMSKTGYHWTQYGAYMALDSTLAWFNKRKEFPGLKLNWESVEIDPSKNHIDTDINNALDLIWKKDELALAFPVISSPDSSRKPKVMSIADSFFWTIYNTGVLGKVYTGDSKFAFYYKTVMNISGGDKKAYELDMRRELYESDFVEIMSSVYTIERLGYDFIDDVYAMMKRDEDSTRAAYRRELEQLKWQDLIRSNSKSEGISKEEYIQKNIHVLMDRDNRALPYEREVKKSSSLVAALKEKAHQNNTSLDWEVYLFSLDQLAAHQSYFPQQYISEIYFHHSQLGETRGILHWEKVIFDVPDWIENVKNIASQKGRPVEEEARDHAKTYWEDHEEEKYKTVTLEEDL